MRRLATPKAMFGVVPRSAAVLLLSVCCCYCALCANEPEIVGRVLDTAGNPIVDATVMVYHAGPTTGYSLFCPSCYADCGKRQVTDTNGMFSFHHLSSGLWFKLLVAKTGYDPRFVEKVIPTTDVPVTATLDARPRVGDPNRVFRGRIVDSNGLAQHDAVVQPVGALWDAKTAAYGTIPGLDPIAVTDQQGVFEIESFPAKRNWMPSATGPPLKILVAVEARGMAEAFSAIPAGLEPEAITVTDGAVVRGRLVQDGKPVEGAEVGLVGYPRGGWGPNFKMVGSPYEEIRIGTRADGTFEIANVPVPGNWYVYAKMEAVATRGATGNIARATKANHEVVDIGDLQVKPGYHLHGRVVLSDGKPIKDGMTVTISSEEAFDSQTVTLPSTGTFEFIGLAPGSYSVFASVKGYSPPPMAPVSIKAEDGRIQTYTPPPPPVSIEHDIGDFVITLHPEVSASKSDPR